jgi:hypothetical protein
MGIHGRTDSALSFDKKARPNGRSQCPARGHDAVGSIQGIEDFGFWGTSFGGFDP